MHKFACVHCTHKPFLPNLNWSPRDLRLISYRITRKLSPRLSIAIERQRKSVGIFIVVAIRVFRLLTVVDIRVFLLQFSNSINGSFIVVV